MYLCQVFYEGTKAYTESKGENYKTKPVHETIVTIYAIRMLKNTHWKRASSRNDVEKRECPNIELLNESHIYYSMQNQLQMNQRLQL